jgi:hypothetical protein
VILIPAVRTQDSGKVDRANPRWLAPILFSYCDSDNGRGTQQKPGTDSHFEGQQMIPTGQVGDLPHWLTGRLRVILTEARQ